MAKGFPIMLTGSAFSHYTRTYAKQKLSYRELVDVFRSWYTSEEQRYRLLQSWQHPSLLREMQNNTEKSELEVFHGVADNLTKIQHQLHTAYHDPRFLRDQLLVAADIPHLRRSLIEKIPATAQEAMQRIATLLSSAPRSAAAHCIDDQEDQVNYGTGKRFGGDARKRLKGSASRGSGRNRKSLASIKGCWCCGKDHRARDHHSSEDILAALNRLKKSNPTVLFTVADMDEFEAAFLAAYSMDTEDSESDDDEAHVILEPEHEELLQEHEIYLANISFMHGRTFSSDLEKEMKEMHTALSVGEVAVFDGLILDTGANRRSAMSLQQYQAYCREFKVPMKIDYSDNRGLVGIGGTTESLGTAVVPIPFKDLDLVADVRFRILKNNCPTLLCLRDMIENGLDISIQDQTISYDFLKHKWTMGDVSYAMYTDQELRRLHRVFGHPSVSALQKLLKRANPEEYGTDVRDTIEKITRLCDTCTRTSSKPRRFKISVGSDDLRFNHILAIDIMTLAGKSVFHAVDEATHYTAAVFLKKQTAEDTWKALLRCWSRVYLGPQDHIRMDQGSNLVAKHFKASAEAEGITVLEAPIESPNTMSHVERYHAPLRTAFTKIRDELDRTETDNDCLQLAVKAVNDNIGPEGLCPTLLVYGTLPRPPRRSPADTQMQRARELDLAPRSAAVVQLMASSMRHPTRRTFKEMEKVVEWCHKSATIGMKFVPLKRHQAKLSLFTDASFANTDKHRSQMGFVLVIGDDEKSNIIHYGSSSCKRVTRSVMAAELHALIYGFDSAYLARDILQELLGLRLDIDAYVDSRTVFNVVAKQSSTLEKRLQIDVHALRESHSKGELRYLAWIPGNQNVADALTKGLIDARHPLWNLMTKNRLEIKPNGWVEGCKSNCE